jgi:transposase
VVGVEQWAEIRRMYFVGRLSIKEIVRRSGHSRNTIRRALRSGEPPRYRRPPRPSKLDPFREEIQRLLRSDPRLPGRRMRELLEEQGYAGGKTILDDYLREVRPLFLRERTFQRTSYRPGVFCQFDLWQPSRESPVGGGQTRRGYVVVGCLPYSRAGAGTLVFSKEAPDLLYGIGDCLAKLGALPGTLVWDREGALHAGEGRPSEPFAAFCGELRVGWRFLGPHDPQSKGVVERLQGFMETSFEPGRSFVGELDFQEQLDRWFGERANLRFHRTLRCRPADRLVEELTVMRPLPERMPDVDRRLVPGSRPTRTSASTATTTRSTRAWSAAASSCASRNERSSPWRSTRASSLAGTDARSRATARLLRSSTPARCASCAASRPSPRSSSGRFRSTTP